eukprot:CAMPEP_0117560190 /NCGR_PEP_ID=MMETSP0784-20121206/53748_1 /TAXON_ID=39447 /ORGANISM="" /LENGTH=1103 /DNA_ID=CAMNT_0005357591 /DNA_START=91 /DNA_END=3402 /DNA_ORIENTATION=-
MTELLSALLSSQNAERSQAESMYQQARTSEPEQLIVGLVAALADSSVDQACRTQGAVLLRQLVTSTPGKEFAFGRLAPARRQEVADELLRRYEAESDPKLQKKIGEVVAKLAECTHDEKDQSGWLTSQCGWPALLPFVFRMANAPTNPNAASCESALRLLQDLVSEVPDQIGAAQQQVGDILKNGLVHQDAKVSCAGLLLVCEMVRALEKTTWAPLTSTVSVLHQVLQRLAQANMTDEIEECIQAFTEVASVEPDFFKQQLATELEPAKFLATVLKSREAEEGVRSLALEWMVTYAEKRPKLIAKSMPQFAALAMECCADLLVEIEDSADELKAWAERMDDEEGEEDSDELFHAGEQAIDRIVEAMGIESTSVALFALVSRLMSYPNWQAKHAALAVLKQTVEYVEEMEHVNQVAQLLLQHIEHEHPRVRYTALQAIGQLGNDQAPQFQESWHRTVMPALLKKMDDPVDRVASMAMSAFVSFGGDLDNALMMEYSQAFMEKLVARLRSTQHRMVQEESITSIAVIAGVIESDFSQYYVGIMPILKQVVLTRTGEKESRLRGKAFECMSLLGLAVGKERFLPDAREAVGAMLQTQVDAEDIQREYIKEASERICKCLKADFAPFLPHLLPGIFKALKFDGEDVAGKPDADDDEYLTMTTEDGKLVKVRTAKFEEMLQALQLLHTFCEEMESAFYDCVPQTAEALVPIFSKDNAMPMLCDETRSAALQTWALLIKCARVGAEQRGVKSDLPRELMVTFLQKACEKMDEEDDPETVNDTAEGIAECLKSAGPGVLSGQELVQLVQALFTLIDKSFERSSKAEEGKKANVANAPAQLRGGEDDDDDDDQDDEENCRRSCEDAIGRVMQTAPGDFVQCLPECAQRMQQWLAMPKHRALALFLGCDLIEHLKDQAQPILPVFVPAVFAALAAQDPEVRIPAAYAISLAAPLQVFAEAVPEAFRSLAKLAAGPAPKKRDQRGRVALDNVVSALLVLARVQPALCPQEVPAWELVVSKLPLMEDEEEARKVHAAIVDLLAEQHAGLLGSDATRLGKILSALAEVYHKEELCTKETDAKIQNIFKCVPQEKLASLAASFTEKQQRKITKMVM